MILNKYNIYIVGVLLIFTGLAIILLNDGHNWGGDFALYLAEAEALINGDLKVLFVENSFTVQHSHEYLSPNLYPLGYPIFLFVPMLIFGKMLWVYKLLNIFLLVYLGWRIFQSNNLFMQLPKWALIFGITLFLFRDTLFFQLEIIGPDILFLVLVFECLFAFYLNNLLATAILTLSLLITRDAGLIFWIVFNFYGIFFKNISSLISFILGIILIGFTKDFSANHWDYFLVDINFVKFQENLNRFYLQYIESLIPLNRFKNLFVRCSLLILLIMGLVNNYRNVKCEMGFKKLKEVLASKRFWITISLIVYIMVHLFWKSLALRMFLITELLFIYFIISGLTYFCRTLDELKFQRVFLFSRVFKWFVFLFVVSVAIKHIYRSYSWCYQPNSVFGDKVNNANAVILWNAIKQHTELNAIVVFRKPRVLRYYTKRRSCTRLDNDVLELAEFNPVYRLKVNGLSYAETDNVIFIKIWSDGDYSLEMVKSQ
jgi:hypothetical protein